MIETSPPMALVTGASSGIGAELARELVRDGHDVILAARSLPPMQGLAAELRRERPALAVPVVAADLSRPGAAAVLIDELAARGLRIDVLVANAGLGGAGRFDLMAPVRIAEMLAVNIVALTELTRLVLPGMVARGRGRIMLVGSVAGFQPGPQMAVYFATKSYVLSFGEAIAYELRNTGVTVTTVCPGATATNFFAVARDGRATPGRAGLRRMMSAAAVARDGYRALRRGQRVVVTGLANRIFAFGGRHAPHALTLPVTNRMMSGE